MEGDPGDSQVWVGNHLGYLDVVGLATVRPAAFVSKAEVGSWPVVGALARRAGTIFLDRKRRLAVGEAVHEMRRRVEAGLPVVFFPEGTSSDGSRVLPFRPSLFGPVCEEGWRVCPFALRYEVRGGRRVDPAYWGDATFAPHLMRLLRHDGLRLHIRFGTPVPPSGDRKQEAEECWRRVAALHAQQRPSQFAGGLIASGRAR